MTPPDGVLLVDKPAGLTSHDVVARVRRRLPRGTKVGHAGTLDPFATGLLVVLLGRATRVQRFLMALPKTYETVARLGHTSTTGDPEGEVVRTGRIPPAGEPLPTGRIRQVPPAYSAIKVGGRRAYALARAGESVDIAAREVEVHTFEELWREGDDRAAYRIRCSAGTYVRTLIADLGDAYCLELRRTAIGHFDVADAQPPPERLEKGEHGDPPGGVIALGDALSHLPQQRLEGEAAKRASHGLAVTVTGASDGTYVRLVDEHGLIALAERRPGDLLKPVVGFRA